MQTKTNQEIRSERILNLLTNRPNDAISMKRFKSLQRGSKLALNGDITATIVEIVACYGKVYCWVELSKDNCRAVLHAGYPIEEVVHFTH